LETNINRLDMPKVFKISLLVFLAVCSLILFLLIAPKTLIHYKSTSFSGIVLDDYSGKPVEGARVTVSWDAFRGRWPEGSDMMNLHTVTISSDKAGVYTVPAWEVKAPREWVYYEFNPGISLSLPNTKPKPDLDAIPEFSVPANSHGWAFQTIHLKPPEWAIDRRSGFSKNWIYTPPA